MIEVLFPLSSHDARTQVQIYDTRMDLTISPAVAALAIAAAVVGPIFVFLLGFCIFERRRKAKRREQEEEMEVSAALDRAIVSYIVNERPSTQRSSTQESRRQLGHAVANALRMNVESVAHNGPPCFPHCPSSLCSQSPPPLPPPIPPPPPPTKPSKVFSPRPVSSPAATSTVFRRRTASSHFVDSAKRAYGDILVRPIERDSVALLSRVPESIPAARKDDIGWPLMNGHWL